MELKMSFSRNLAHVSLCIIILIPFIGILWFASLNMISYAMIVASLLVLVLLTILLHTDYWEASKNVTYFISHNEIQRVRHGKTEIYHSDEIEEIRVYLSSAKYAGIQFGNFAFEDYYYCKVILKNRGEIILTSLLSNDIEQILKDNFPNLPFKRFNDFYPSIR